MRTKFFSVILILALISCSTTKTFPLSEVAPAAEITVKQKTDNNDNNEVKIKAKYLASPERVSNGAVAYVVWLVSQENGIKNIGALYNKNGKTSELETITSFIGSQVFITAEKEVGISRPDGVEVSRVKL